MSAQYLHFEIGKSPTIDLNADPRDKAWMINEAEPDVSDEFVPRWDFDLYPVWVPWKEGGRWRSSPL